MQDNSQQSEGKERYVLRAGGAVGAGALIAVLLLHGAGVWGLMYGMGTTANVPVEHPPIKAEMLPPPQPPPPPP
ncbi:energy transducer TonB, partial [Acetobacter pomorum]